MNKYQKLVQKQFLNNEEAVIHRLEQVYYHSQKQVEKELAALQKQIDAIDMQYSLLENMLSDEEKEILLSKKRSKVYQKKYQEGLKKQLDTILDDMLDKEYKTVSDYLQQCYEDGFIGTMYDLQGQGIPLCMPLDQESMVRAVQLDSKISKGLYEHLGEDVTVLKKGIAAEISRGISTSMTYSQIAKQLSQRMVGTYENPGGSLAYAMRIARTEGHRIQVQAGMDACYKAKEKGCDVVKQWDATLDQRTRERHREVDGQIRDLDDKFSNGLMFPGDPAGGASEVVNCRCALLQRARWALDDEELEILKGRAKYYGLDKTEDFEDYKKKYLKAAERIRHKEKFIQAKTKQEAEDYARQKGVKYADYSKLPIDTANEINRALETLPNDVRPVFVGDSSTLEKYWGGKLPRSSKQYYGVTIDTFDGIHLGIGNGIDFDTNGQMVGISYSYRTADKITASKRAAQARYQEKHSGHTWFFNVSGETTPFHEMGHVYANIKGLPDGFEYAASKWADETKCDMISSPSEAWAEAWAAYHTGTNELPDYIRKFIEDVVEK